MRGQISYLIEPYQISAQDSATLQAGADAMVGRSVSYEGGKNIAFAIVGQNAEGFEIDFNGHQGNDC